ncbi:Sec-independent protein translocase protein TatB [Allosphingosinicella sp.]|jgi:sec-independent protein translocase protein TatB|uniref:Sec-independent protein translocase protein TatB n=1 Tax=Allosphingosinicella sp. TaxID=2823234 RepID=UPI002F03B4F8
MFDIASTELLIIAIVALVVIGPKDLPKVMRTIGNWIARARGMAGHFRSGVDTMMREAELDEMQKTWAADNERIMREHPTPASQADALPPPVAGETAGPAQSARPKPPRAPPRRPAPPAPNRAPPVPGRRELP